MNQVKEAYICKGFNTCHHPSPDHLIELRKALFVLYYTKNAINYYVSLILPNIVQYNRLCIELF